VAGEIFFITNGDPIPFWDFPHKLWAHLAEAGIEPVPTRKVVAMPRIVGLFIGLVAEIMGWITGKDPLFTRYRVKFTCATRWHNISKARRILGYEPLISNDEGIKRSADVRSHRWFCTYNDR
jgi:sterol-4alpha-carboxylate 3-dehydrogenase (decarboxylating)